MRNDEYIEDGLDDRHGFTGEWEMTYLRRAHLRVREPMNNSLWTVTVWTYAAHDQS